jgi:hypothetical protein
MLGLTKRARMVICFRLRFRNRDEQPGMISGNEKAMAQDRTNSLPAASRKLDVSLDGGVLVNQRGNAT